MKWADKNIMPKINGVYQRCEVCNANVFTPNIPEPGEPHKIKCNGCGTQYEVEYVRDSLRTS